MDPQTFLDIATKVTKLKMYPYFDIAHYTLMCVAARDDVPANSSGKVTQHCHIWLFTARASFTITIARNYVILDCFNDKLFNGVFNQVCKSRSNVLFSSLCMSLIFSCTVS